MGFFHFFSASIMVTRENVHVLLNIIVLAEFAVLFLPSHF